MYEKKIIMICTVLSLILSTTGTAIAGMTYEALFTSEDHNLSGRFTMPSGYASTYNGGTLSGGIDGAYDFGLSSGPDYTGWNADHTGLGKYDDPSRGWYYEFNNGGYTDAYSSTETTDSGYVEFEWTFNNVVADPLGYLMTVTVDDLDDYVAKKGASWASVPDEWKVYVNGSYIGALYDYDDPQGSGPDRSINIFNVGNVSGSVKIEVNGTYFDLLHDPSYYGGPTKYGDYASWGDTASAQHGIRLEGLELSPVPAPGAILLGAIGVGLVGWLKRRRTF